MTRTERRQGGFTAEQSAVRYEKNYLSLYTDISADVYRLVGAVGSVFIPVFSSVGRADSAGGHPYSTVRRRGDSCGEYDDGSIPSAPTKT